MEAALVFNFSWISAMVSYDGCPTIGVTEGCGNESTIFSNDEDILFDRGYRKERRSSKH